MSISKGSEVKSNDKWLFMAKICEDTSKLMTEATFLSEKKIYLKMTSILAVEGEDQEEN